MPGAGSKTCLQCLQVMTTHFKCPRGCPEMSSWHGAGVPRYLTSLEIRSGVNWTKCIGFCAMEHNWGQAGIACNSYSRNVQKED